LPLELAAGSRDVCGTSFTLGTARQNSIPRLNKMQVRLIHGFVFTRQHHRGIFFFLKTFWQIPMIFAALAEETEQES